MALGGRTAPVSVFVFRLRLRRYRCVLNPNSCPNSSTAGDR
jgi:hypothetical protein